MDFRNWCHHPRKWIHKHFNKPQTNMSKLDQRCFNVVDQRWNNFVDQCWNNFDLTLKMKQNLTSDFQHCTMLIQGRWKRCITLIQRFINVAHRCFNTDITLFQRCFNVASTIVKPISKPIWLVICMNLQIDWYAVF